MSDNGKIKRRPLSYYLRVFDRSSDRLVGRLVDISVESFQVLGECETEMGNDYPLRIVLPTQMNDRTQIDFNARNIWCKEDNNPDFFSLGFQFNGLPSEEKEIIQRLIRKSGFTG